MNKIFKFNIFFGDNKSCSVDYKTSAFEEFCQTFAATHKLEKILFNKQVHGIDGFVIDSVSATQEFKNIYHEGDFLITNQQNIGIGVLTADCLPILFYDQKNSIIAAIHAGWRSSVLGICQKTFDVMEKRFGSKAQDLDVYFGPCAKACCYQVQPDFLSNLEKFTYKEQLVNSRNNNFYFDNVLLNKLQLKEIGIEKEKINCYHNLCTLCNNKFNSYRRNQTKSRQISFVALSK